jgi:hypothetical protein
MKESADVPIEDAAAPYLPIKSMTGENDVERNKQLRRKVGSDHRGIERPRH